MADVDGSDVAAVRAAIALAWQEHIEAARQKDVAHVTQIYSDDVTYIIPGVQEARGRAEIDELEAAALASADVLEARHSTSSLRLFGDHAYELGTVIGPVRPKGEAARTVTFHYMALWRRQPDGSWRIQSMIGEPVPDDPDDEPRPR